jgi:hydrogenase small subunit
MAVAQTFPVAAEHEALVLGGRCSRRDFLRYCSFITAVLALPPRYATRVAQALEAASATRPTVIWLELQDCAGDTESFLRSSHPTASQFVFDLVDLAYHETLMAPAGEAAESGLEAAIERAEGSYVLVVEGSIPLADGGVYCTIGGRSAEALVREVAAGAAAVVAVGTCAAYGGLPAAAPNPTGAVGVSEVLTEVPVMNLPGCPVNAVNLSAALVHLLTFGELPAMDELGRPLFAYGGLLHDSCPRRAHFDAGRFVKEWGDEGHRQGWCLYEMGCKGPSAYSNCPLVGWNDTTSWPIGVGHPCIACTEPGFWDASSPMYRWMGQEGLPSPGERERTDEALGVALGVGGAVVAAGVGAAVMARQRRRAAHEDVGAGPEGGEAS